MNCRFCDRAILFRHSSRGFYCSNTCQRNFEWQTYKNKILSGEEEFKNNRRAKRFLLEYHGNKCAICKRKTWLGKSLLLILDHINGDGYNYKLDNIRLICSNCDAQTPTYKAKNKGRGRITRRLRYKKVC